MPNSAGFSVQAWPIAVRSRLLVTTIAENILTATPIASVKAKPMTRLAPKLEPNQYSKVHVISVETFESRMDDHARSKPASMAPPS